MIGIYSWPFVFVALMPACVVRGLTLQTADRGTLWRERDQAVRPRRSDEAGLGSGVAGPHVAAKLGRGVAVRRVPLHLVDARFGNRLV
jgi:hypothetical protein